MELPLKRVGQLLAEDKTVERVEMFLGHSGPRQGSLISVEPPSYGDSVVDERKK